MADRFLFVRIRAGTSMTADELADATEDVLSTMLTANPACDVFSIERCTSDDRGWFGQTMDGAEQR